MTSSLFVIIGVRASIPMLIKGGPTLIIFKMEHTWHYGYSKKAVWWNRLFVWRCCEWKFERFYYGVK
jgi:hypothetical protein